MSCSTPHKRFKKKKIDHPETNFEHHKQYFELIQNKI